ncbi:MAG: rod shape-determining protein MreC [Chloroflexi bacterium SZAS-1]|jgi:rod shape-determining protein MreC|nr:rod shape-determining protein MreC [Chloroflexi bacterium SZAS-1]
MRDSVRNRSMRLPRPSPYRSLTLIVSLLVLALLLLVLDQGGLLGPLRAQVQTVLTPLIQPLRRLGDSMGGVGQSLTEVQQLRDRVTALEHENSQLKAENIQVHELRQRLDQLEAQLRIEKERGWQLLGADVSARSPDGGRRMLMLNAGAEQHIRPGMAVLGQEGSSPPTLIGVVENVGPRSASVLLITDYSSAVSAKVYHQNSVATGVVQGQWQIGSRLKLEAIDRAQPLAQGDVVFTAGLTAQFDNELPRAAIVKDIPIGTIENIEIDGHNQTADVRPFVDPDRVTYAWVLISQNE